MTNLDCFLSIIFYIISIFIYNYYSYIDYKKKEIAIVDNKLKIGAYCQVQSKNAPICSAKVHHLVTPIY
tara:strand:+ start:13889 stop:14095 length:207 start_codon:yes stop_codon:yes gene_type:complete